MRIAATQVFKTAWFAKTASKSNIPDTELCAAVLQAMRGQADDLGGGIFKKRLNDNLHRSILLAKGGHRWVFEFLFAKSARANINDDELVAFRKLARIYAILDDSQVDQLVASGQFVEICNADKA
jgi:hypothetical protein